MNMNIAAVVVSYLRAIIKTIDFQINLPNNSGSYRWFRTDFISVERQLKLVNKFR